MKKVRRILCGALAALLLAGCGSGAAGEYAIVETSYPARTQKTEERVDTEELVRFSSETAEVILPAGENAVYAPVSLYLSLGMLTELTEGRTKEQVTELLGVSDSETLRQWTQSLWRQLYCDEKDSALWLGTAAFLNEAMTFHKEPLEVLAEDYYASSYGLPMGTSGADKAIAAWLDRQTNDLLTDDTGAIRTEKRDLLRLYNTIYYKAAWQAEFFGGATAEDIFTAADGTEQKTDFMHRTESGSYRKGDGYTAAPRSLNYGRMVFVLPDEGVTPESLLQQQGFLAELTGDYNAAELVWSVPKFDVKSSTELNGVLQALGVTDAFDWTKADFTPLTDNGAFLSSAMQAARVKIDEEGVEAAAYTEIVCADSAMMEVPPTVEMDLDRPFLFVIFDNSNVPLFVGTVNTMA